MALVCQKIGEANASFIIVNLYAPNPHNETKIAFLESIFDAILELEQIYDCQNAIAAGDFNIVFSSRETKNRSFGRAEKLVSTAIKEMLNQADLQDIWSLASKFTWRRPNSECFSTIDRVLFKANSLKLNKIRTNRSLSFSDHAAVEVGFTYKTAAPKIRSKITRLDPSLVKDEETKGRLIRDVSEMFTTHSASWTPHLKTRIFLSMY